VAETAEQVCSLGSQTCTVTYAEKTFGGCECVSNCDCESAGFTEKMNDYCRKLGDCGGEINVEGKYSENYDVQNAPRLSNSYISGLIALARALCNSPSAIVMDEPFSSLDATMREKIRAEVISIINNLGITAVIVSHNLEDCIITSDRVVF